VIYQHQQHQLTMTNAISPTLCSTRWGQTYAMIDVKNTHYLQLCHVTSGANIWCIHTQLVWRHF